MLVVVSLCALVIEDVVDVGDGGGGEAGGESGMPKGVSSSLTLEEDATLGVAERWLRCDDTLERALSVR